MPRRLTIDTAVEGEAKSWVRSLIRAEMARQELSYRDLAERLAAIGMAENERNIANKVARGELSAVAFLLCLKVMGSENLRLDDRSFSSALGALDDSLTVDQVLESELITIVERDEAAGIFRIRIGKLSTPITILLSQLGTNIRPALSHVIEPPGTRRGLGLHMPSVFRSPQSALATIIKLLVDAYETGIQAGHTPEESWLIPLNALRERSVTADKNNTN